MDNIILARAIGIIAIIIGVALIFPVLVFVAGVVIIIIGLNLFFTGTLFSRWKK